MSSNEWLKDYEEFLTENEKVPEGVSSSLFLKMKTLLNPNPFAVFAKILGISFVMGFLSLSVCHQFGLNPFNTKFSLDQWFMNQGGHHACMVFCGVLFISVGVLAAGLFLNVEEVRVLRNHKFVQNFSLGSVLIALLISSGAEVVLGFGILWMIGAVLGGIASTEVLFRVKRISV